MTDKRDKDLARVKKMLALAGNNPEAEEAETAMRMALALLAKYNLDIADVTEDEEGNPVIQADLWSRLTSPWARSICGWVARLYCCDLFFRNYGNQIQYIFVGTEANVAVTKDISDWLIRSANRTATRRQKELGEPFSYRTQFLKAAAARIAQRCYRMIEEAKRGEFDDGMGGKALVPVSMYTQAREANDEYKRRVFGEVKVVEPKERDTANPLATMEGNEWGSRASLNRQLEC